MCSRKLLLILSTMNNASMINDDTHDLVISPQIFILSRLILNINTVINAYTFDKIGNKIYQSFSGISSSVLGENWDGRMGVVHIVRTQLHESC